MIRFECGGDQAEQYDLQCLLSIIRLAAGPAWTPGKIRVCATSSEVFGEVEEFAACEVHRSRKTTAIAFPLSFFSKRLDAPLGAMRMKVEGNSDQITFTVNATAAVEAVMHSLAGFEAVPVLDSMAERFGVCGRTLQRALEAEGASFRDLIDRLMYRRATNLLMGDKLPIKSIASELGYSSAASFVRAFRRYSGTTPAVFRRENHATS